MQDQDMPETDLPSENDTRDNADIGRPNWELREQEENDEMSGEENSSDQGVSDQALTESGNAHIDNAEPDESALRSASAEPQADRDSFENESIENGDATKADQGGEISTSEDVRPWSLADMPTSLGDDADEDDDHTDDHDDNNHDDTEHDNDSQVDDDEAGNRDLPASAQAVVTADLPEGWDAGMNSVLERWSGYRGRPMSMEAIKTGLILPMLSSLGYDVFSLDVIEPTIDTDGGHSGYLANAANDAFQIVLDERQLAVQSDDVIMLIDGDRAAIGVWIDQDGEHRWQAVLDGDLNSAVSASAFFHMHHQLFQKQTIINLAELIHGQQDDIIDAVRDVLAEPGRGLVEDVRLKLQGQGHDNPAMLAERVTAAIAKLFTTEKPVQADEDNTSEEDDQGRRPLSAAEARAVQIIREICEPEIPANDIVPRPGTAYTGVLYKDNNRRTIVRLHFSAATVKYIGLFTDGEEKKEKIETPEDIREYTDIIRKRLKELDPEAF